MCIRDSLIADLRALGFKTAVASSGPKENVELAVNHFTNNMPNPYNTAFDAVVTGNDVTVGKPNPEVFLLAAKLLNVSPERCIVVEDSAPGVKAAQAANMTCFLLISTGHSITEYDTLPRAHEAHHLTDWDPSTFTQSLTI